MNLPRTRIERLVSEDVGITADTARRLGKTLGTSSQRWPNQQNDYDLQMVARTCEDRAINVRFRV